MTRILTQDEMNQIAKLYEISERAKWQTLAIGEWVEFQRCDKCDGSMFETWDIEGNYLVSLTCSKCGYKVKAS